MPPEVREWLEIVGDAVVAGLLPGWSGFLLQLCVGDDLLRRIGGMLGAVLFKKDVPPALRRPRRPEWLIGRSLRAQHPLTSEHESCRADSQSPEIADLLQEDRRFPPSDAFRAAGERARRRASTHAPSAIRRRSGQGSRPSSSGSRPGQQVLDWKPPHAKWFVGGS